MAVNLRGSEPEIRSRHEYSVPQEREESQTVGKDVGMGKLARDPPTESPCMQIGPSRNTNPKHEQC
jgi:hypothetical protein